MLRFVIIGAFAALCASPSLSFGEDAQAVTQAGEGQAAAGQVAAPSPASGEEGVLLTEIPPQVLSGGEFFKNISVHEPMYFLFGWRHETRWDAKFQLSFKYRFMEHGYVGYTQTSLWDISDESAPFHDTSYRPSLFYFYHDDRTTLSHGYLFRLMAGFEHESNGQGGASSRSINTLFARPQFLFGNAAGDYLVRIEPKFIGYIDKADNPDIAYYRGYGDLLLVFDAIRNFGPLDGLQVSTDLRKGTRSTFGSVQIDLSYPIGSVTYLIVQYFAGWGEAILDYNKKLPSHVRVGFMVVRW